MGEQNRSKRRAAKPRVVKGPQRFDLAGRPYPKHLAGRAFSAVVHGDAAGVENLRRILADWLTDLELIQAGPSGAIGKYPGVLRVVRHEPRRSGQRRGVPGGDPERSAVAGGNRATDPDRTVQAAGCRTGGTAKEVAAGR
jgi:hypothetical protein